MDPKRFSLYGNTITPDQDRKALAWQKMFVDKFNYDPNEAYELSVHDNPHLGDVLGIRDIRRDSQGDPIDPATGVVISTIRMGFGHYRIAMAGASAARSMGYTPLWLDLLAIPGITQDAINWWNTNYSKYSRVSQRSSAFDKYVWESVTSGDKTLPGLNWLLNNQAIGWPWRFLKANARDYRKSELFAEALARFNTTLIRGAGANGRRKDRGGASALRASLRTLEQGVSVGMTADVPPGPARKAGIGIVTLAAITVNISGFRAS